MKSWSNILHIGKTIFSIMAFEVTLHICDINESTRFIFSIDLRGYFNQFLPVKVVRISFFSGNGWY